MCSDFWLLFLVSPLKKCVVLNEPFALAGSSLLIRKGGYNDIITIGMGSSSLNKVTGIKLTVVINNSKGEHMFKRMH